MVRLFVYRGNMFIAAASYVFEVLSAVVFSEAVK